jgi:hypothetical protein
VSFGREGKKLKDEGESETAVKETWRQGKETHRVHNRVRAGLQLERHFTFLLSGPALYGLKGYFHVSRILETWEMTVLRFPFGVNRRNRLDKLRMVAALTLA